MSPEVTSVSRPSTQNTLAQDTADEGQGLSGATEKTASDKQPQEKTDVGADGEHEPEYLEGLRLLLVIFCLILVSFLVLLDTSIIATATPRITSDFKSLTDVGWYGGAYQLAGAALQPLTGKLYTYFHSRPTFLSFFAFFELGSLICGVAPSSTVLIIGRAVAGLGMSGLINGGYTIIAGAVPHHKRVFLLAMVMGFCQLGIVCGPLIGGAFTEYTTRHGDGFYINLPIGGVVALLLVLVRIPDGIEKPKARDIWTKLHHYLDFIGFGLFAGAAIQILLALQWGGNTHPWSSATIIGPFIGGAVTFIVWGFWNSHKGDSALIPFSLVKKRAVWSAALSQLLIFTNVFVNSFFLPIYFQAVKGKSPFTSGVYILPSILSQLVPTVLAGVLVGKLGYYLPWTLASSVLASVGSGLLGTLLPQSSAGTWIGYQVIGGVGRGFGMQMPTLAMQASVQPAEIAVGQAFLMFAQLISIAIFLVVGNTIFDELLRSGLAKYAPNVDASAVIDAGATAFRTVVRPADLPEVLFAYAKAVTAPMYLASAAAALVSFSAWGMGWLDIRKKTPLAGDAERQNRPRRPT